jgi:hypothetical protein
MNSDSQLPVYQVIHVCVFFLIKGEGTISNILIGSHVPGREGGARLIVPNLNDLVDVFCTHFDPYQD